MQWENLSDTIQIAIDDTHRFGTDAFLLEHFAAVRGIDTVCDLCAGCGIIGLLMLAAGTSAPFCHGGGAFPRCRGSYAPDRSSFLPYRFYAHIRRSARRLHAAARTASELVTCNPPYFSAGTGFLCPEDSRRRARHEQQESCTLEEVCAAAAWLLQYGGRFCLCQRPERLTDVLSALRQNRLEPKRLRWVQQSTGESPVAFSCRRKGRRQARADGSSCRSDHGKCGRRATLMK